MNLLGCAKVNTFSEFTKQNENIFKKKLFVFVNGPFRVLTAFEACDCSRSGIGIGFSKLSQEYSRLVP